MTRTVALVAAIALMVSLGVGSALASVTRVEVEDPGRPTNTFTTAETIYANVSTDAFSGGYVCVATVPTSNCLPGTGRPIPAIWGTFEELELYPPRGNAAVRYPNSLEVGTYYLLGWDRDAKLITYRSGDPFKIVAADCPPAETALYDDLCQLNLQAFKQAAGGLIGRATVGRAMAMAKAGLAVGAPTAFVLPYFGIGGGMFALPIGGAVILAAVDGVGHALMDEENEFQAKVDDFWEQLANDPPDPDFASVFQPAFYHGPTPADPLEAAQFQALADQAALTEALLHSFERYQGASAAGDAAAARSQLAASAQYAHQLFDSLNDHVAALRGFAAQIAEKGDEADFVITQEDIDALVAAQNRVRADGLTADERAGFAAAGLTDDEIAETRTAAAEFDLASLVPGARLSEQIETVASDIENYAPFIDQFGDYLDEVLAASASDPDNRPPVAEDDSAVAVVGGQKTIDVLANDADPDGDELTIVSWTDPLGGGDVDCSSGTSCTFQSPTSPGSASFTYTVRDPHGATATAAVTVTVGVAANNPPVASFTATPSAGLGHLTTQLDARASSDEDGNIDSYAWDFGDGSGGSGVAPSHTYTSAGTYRVSLTVTDDEDLDSTAWRNVYVVDPDGLEVPVCGDNDDGTATTRCPDYTRQSGVETWVVGTSGEVTFDYVYRNAAIASQLSAYRVDDEAGTVDGIAPGKDGYLAAALSRAQMVFPVGSTPWTPDSTLSFPPGARIAFFISAYSNEALGDLAGNPRQVTHFSVAAANTDRTSHAVAFEGDGLPTQFAFEDLEMTDSGPPDWDDLVFTALGLSVHTPEANNAPAASDGATSVREGKVRFVSLSATDADFDALTYAIVGGPSHGELTDCSAGFCSYTPVAGYVGEDSFTWKASDGLAESRVATFVITVSANRAPVAVDGSASLVRDTTAAISLHGSDPDGDTLRLHIVDGPEHGVLSDCSGLYCRYQPEAGFIGEDSFTFKTADDLAESVTATITLVVTEPCAPGACISNGVVLLAVNPEGHLNIRNTADGKARGLTYVPTGNEATAPACLCEGWGAADAVSGLRGSANVDVGGVQNMTVESFTATESTAVSTVIIGDALRVTHNYHPSTATQNLYEAEVTIENVSGTELGDVRYRRVMDWDIEPTPFAELVTIETGNSANLLYSSDDGFASADPLSERSQLRFNGEAVDSGPADHGALFDFGFGAVGAGQSVTFKIFYGAGATEEAAVEAVNAVGAEVFSFGQPSTADGPTLGTPNTFIFAFAGVGGEPIFSPVAVGDTIRTAVDQPGSVDVLANDSDPDGDPLEVTSLDPVAAHGDVVCTAAGLCTYTPAPGYVGGDSFEYTISDGRGGSASAHVDVTVSGGPTGAPSVDAGPGASGQEGSAIALAGSASDPDGDALALAWTVAAGPDVDAGASCSFSDPTSASTTITCTDDGTYQVTLTGDDGTNGPVADSATVIVSNAGPSGTITVNPGGTVAVGDPVTVSAVFSDAGSNDTHTCEVDFGDGTVSDGTIAGSTCTAAHTYLGAGVRTITVTFIDDDGAWGRDTVELTVSGGPNVTPSVDAGPGASGQEGSAIALAGSASDPDGDALALAWTVAAGPDVDAGASCSFSDPTSASTTITCTDDGTYQVTLTADDGVNGPVADSATVIVSDAAPKATVTANDGAPVAVGDPVTVSAPDATPTSGNPTAVAPQAADAIEGLPSTGLGSQVVGLFGILFAVAGLALLARRRASA